MRKKTGKGYSKHKKRVYNINIKIHLKKFFAREYFEYNFSLSFQFTII